MGIIMFIIPFSKKYCNDKNHITHMKVLGKLKNAFKIIIMLFQ